MARKKAQRVRSFQDNLKRMLLGYSLAPVLGLLAVCTVIILAVGGFVIAKSNQKVNRQITDTLEDTLDSYELLAGEIAKTPGVIDPLMSSTKRQKLVRRLYTVSLDTGFEAELYLLDGDGTLCTSVNTSDTEDEVHKKDLAQITLPDGSAEEGSALYVVTLGGSKRIYLVHTVSDSDGDGTAGYVVLGLSAESFTNLISSHIQTNLITGESGWVFAASSYRFVDAVGRVERNLQEKTGFCMLHGQYCYSSVSRFRDGALAVYTVTDNSEVVKLLFTVLLTSLGVLLIVVMASLSSAGRMAKKTTVDIVEINDAFSQVMEGNLDAYLDLHSSTEFESIARYYNHMLDSLKRQIASNRELAETVAEAQVRQLKSQFNSHFLFNTLDNIRFMCRIDPELAEHMTITLSELLRYNTSRANEKVTVEEDLKYIQLYLEIIKVRFRERFDYLVEIDEAVRDKRLPKLVMQPIIENAIKHGFGNREHLTVAVRVFQSGDTLTLQCRDDGVGIEDGLLENIRRNLALPENESPHLGLYNIHRRITLIYGDSYGMQVESTNGVTVTLTLPLEDKGEEVAL